MKRTYFCDNIPLKSPLILNSTDNSGQHSEQQTEPNNTDKYPAPCASNPRDPPTACNSKLG